MHTLNVYTVSLSVILLLSGCGGGGDEGAIAYDCYVDVRNGDDNNPGTSTQPFKTIAKATGKLLPGTGCATAGQRILVRVGNYNFRTGDEPFSSVSPRIGVELYGEGGGMPGSSATLQGLSVTLADNTVLSGFVMNLSSETEDAVYIEGNNVLVSDNHIIFARSAISSYYNSGSRVSDNVLVDNETGITVGGSNLVIENNVIINNSSAGVHIDYTLNDITEPRPDLGEGDAGSIGGNFIVCNGTNLLVDDDLAVAGAPNVYANSNFWDNANPFSGDIVLTAGKVTVVADNATKDPGDYSEFCQP